MPLPTPRKNEDQDSFVSRCMGDGGMVEEYPDEDQRAAVCHQQWRDDKRESRTDSSVLRALMTTPWAIEPETLRLMVAIAERQHTIDPAALAARRDAYAGRREALLASGGQRLEGSSGLIVRDGVAVLPIEGPIFKRAGLFAEISGATSTEAVARDATAALDAPGVHALVLLLDSPGGEATAIHEAANMLYAARGRKPIVAYVQGLGASAAYWLASAADEVVADATAILGSIGVVMPVRPREDGEIEIVSSQSPHKRPDVRTKDGRARLQQVVDDMAAVFIASVARNRGVTVETVTRDFGGGGVFVGERAVAAGLADRLGSLEGVMRQLAAGEWRSPHETRRADAPAAKGTDMSDEKMSLARKVLAWLNEEETIVAETTETTPAASAPQPTPTPTPAASTPPASDEIAALKAQLASERAARAEEAAAIYADGLQRAGAIAPAQHAAVKALYLRAMSDDLEHPAAEKRTALVARALDGATPFKELITATAEPLRVLPPRETTPRPDAEAEPDEERVKRLAAMTDVGRRAIGQ